MNNEKKEDENNDYFFDELPPYELIINSPTYEKTISLDLKITLFIIILSFFLLLFN